LVKTDAPDRHNAKAHSRRYFVLSLSAILVAMFVLIGGHVLLAQNQATLDQLRREVTENRNQYDAVRLEVAQLRSPDRIISEAEALGLREPKTVQYVQPVPITPSQSAKALAPDQSPALTDDASSQQKVERWEEIKPKLDGRP
jgi:hypothetical protein